MVEFYRNEIEARKLFKTSFEILDNENLIQHPDAEFICALPVVRTEDGVIDLTVLFLLEEKQTILKAWVVIDIEDDSSVFLDEYYEI